MRRLILAMTALLAYASAAAAGDYADRDIIGFSPDGRFFAFEEYGIQDGSGFPYSNIYLIDTSTDSWVSGTPVRVRIDDESVPLETARTQARAGAAAALSSRGVGLPGRLLVSNPLTEVVADRHFAEFFTLVFVPPQTDTNIVTIEEYPLPVKSCPADFGQTMGFDLTLQTVDGMERTLHHDDAIPASRGCPIAYGVSDVVAFDSPTGEVVLIILLNVFQIGFEGPDRRFMAIATSIPQPY